VSSKGRDDPANFLLAAISPDAISPDAISPDRIAEFSRQFSVCDWAAGGHDMVRTTDVFIPILMLNGDIEQHFVGH
jgi:hypothetical protein